MTELTTAKLREMLECAKKATPGPWEVGHDGPSRPIISTGNRDLLIGIGEIRNGGNHYYENEEVDSVHIANMDPQNSIALIEECLRARGETV